MRRWKRMNAEGSLVQPWGEDPATNSDRLNSKNHIIADLPHIQLPVR